MYDADLFWCCSSLYVTITDSLTFFLMIMICVSHERHTFCYMYNKTNKNSIYLLYFSLHNITSGAFFMCEFYLFMECLM